MRGRAAVAAIVTLLVAGGAGADAATSRRPDPLRAHQWGLARVHAPEAWRISRGRGVVVAIVDSGIDLGHPDLRGKLVGGVNLLVRGKSPQDDFGHGTHVAGIVAASTDNGVGIAGVAPDARLMPVKVLDETGTGSVADIAAGIVWAADHGAKVINLSLGQDAVVGAARAAMGLNDVLHQAVAHAWGKGAILIAAAGNMSYPICSEPAAVEHVVCVGALGPDNAGAWYTQRDATMTVTFVCAPGGDDLGVGTEDDDTINILSTIGRGTRLDTQRTGYVSLSGTSMAAPHVAGIAALLAARGYRNAEIVRRLTQTAVDLGTPGRDPVYGYGLVDAVRALA